MSSLNGSPCAIDGCGRKKRYPSSLFCAYHYEKKRIHGDPLYKKPEPPRTSRNYRTAHRQVEQLFGKASEYSCVSCGGESAEWAYDGTDPTELTAQFSRYSLPYSVYEEFYMPMCLACHRARDGAKRAAKNTHCRRGHEFTPANTMKPSTRGRQCKTCYLEGQKKAYRRRRANKIRPQ